MRLSRVLLVPTAILFGAMVVSADSISPSDPQMIIGRGFADQIAITTLSPLFEPVDAKGGGLFGFVNDTGLDLTALVLTIDFKDAAAAKAFAAKNCSSSPMANSIFQNVFGGCSFSRHGHTLKITLAGGSGILPGGDFFVDLNDGATLAHHGHANGAGGWGGDLELQPEGASAIPEPGTLALLVAGFGGLWLGRKRMA